MILHYFKKKGNKEKKIAEENYINILNKVQQIIKINNFFIEKNYNSSFEMISLFIIVLIKKNIFENKNNYKKINEYIISTFINDLDESLRRTGVGDMSIGKHVKSYVKKFYFRLKKFPDYKELSNIKLIENYLRLTKIIIDGQYTVASKKILKEVIEFNY